jgi:hypothetical protein
MLHRRAGRPTQGAVGRLKVGAVRSISYWVPLFVAGLPACSNTGPESDRVCTGSVRVTATNTTTPMVTWFPQCQVNVIVFHEPDFLVRALWVVLDPARGNPITSPVQFGMVPAGATEEAPAIPMVAGGTYVVELWVSNSAALFGMFVGGDTLVATSVSVKGGGSRDQLRGRRDAAPGRVWQAEAAEGRPGGYEYTEQAGER